MNKMVMITSNGAAVMLGSGYSIHTKLREFHPHMVEFHCEAALEAGKAYKSVRYFVQVENMLKANFLTQACILKSSSPLLVFWKINLRLKKLYDIG